MSDQRFSKVLLNSAYPQSDSFSTPNKKRYSGDFQKKSPLPFRGLLNELSQSREEFTKIASRLNSRSLNTQVKSYRPYESNVSGPPERYWKGLYHGRNPSMELKNKYDRCNNSPITHTSITDNSIQHIMHKKSYSFHLMQSPLKPKGRLITKRILKGMGYQKSNIFFSN